MLEAAKAYWREWSAAFSYKGLYQTQVLRSALTLKALTYAPTGGIVAAATTSLPEEVGGERNWDYRYTWIRDATFAIYALNLVGFIEEADAFKRWLKRATAGRAQDLQIMYGLAGERRLAEFSLDHLEGYRGSRPVRIGNGAHTQLQLDIFGEVLDSAYLYRKYCGEFDEEYWQFCRDVVEFVMQSWREPDEGIWETRGGRKHFIFSKVMCWVALDRAIRVSDSIAWDDQAEIERWKAAREEIKEDVLRHGYDEGIGAFVQSYGSANLDASVLMLPLVGFIKASDPRMRSTIEQIERNLTSPQGLVYRYKDFDDGLAGHEGTFNLCSFWLVDNLIYLGEIERAEAMMNTLFGYANDVGLFSEEIGPWTARLWATSPRPSPTWRSSTPPSSSTAPSSGAPPWRPSDPSPAARGCAPGSGPPRRGRAPSTSRRPPPCAAAPPWPRSPSPCLGRGPRPRSPRPAACPPSTAPTEKRRARSDAAYRRAAGSSATWRAR